ncbi:MAG TPA: hypothetical protein VK013_06585 [Myxococcaceae bacterium]|nr:hypothetical protein [Myxococcaceae bacterium]
MSPLLRALAVLTAVGSFACTTTQQPVEASSSIEVIEEGNGGGSALQEVETQDGFRVKLPTPTEPTRNSAQLAEGEVHVAAWSAQDMSGVTYSIAIADYPEALVAKITPDVFLSEGRKGVMAELTNAEIVEESAVELEGHPGTAYTINSDNGTVKGRNYLVGNRLYTQLVIFNSAVGAPEADTFLNSLELIDPPAAPAAEPVEGEEAVELEDQDASDADME